MDFNECGNFLQVIKPCQKCGSLEHFYYRTEQGNQEFEYSVYCSKCGAEIEKMRYTLTTSCSRNMPVVSVYMNKDKEN